MEEIIRIEKRGRGCRLVFASGGERTLPAAMVREWPVSRGPFDAGEWDGRMAEKAGVFALRELVVLESRRDHTRAELYAALVSAGYPGDAAEQALDRMGDAGLVSDERYCGSLVRRKRKNCGRGKMLLEMRRRGVDGETAGQALEAFPEEEETAAAAAYARRLRARGASREKVFRSLMNRGYARGVCLKAISLSEQDEKDVENDQDSYQKR